MSPKQRLMLEYLFDHHQAHGYMPTVREIGQEMAMQSPATVHGYLARLVKQGYLTHAGKNKSRAVALTPLAYEVLGHTELLASPDYADDEPIPQVAPPALMQIQPNGFIFQQNSHTMINIGILQGDYLIIEPRTEAAAGELVLVELDTGAQELYRYFPDGDLIRLQPENNNLVPIVTRDAAILGRLAGLYRAY